MKFSREAPPFTYRDYSKYRPYTRRDFKRVCAHCFRHEDEAGGEGHFVQDHFEPKHRENVDPADYFNLYWSCVACNGPKNKGGKWPTALELERGERFCDPCHHDPVGTDYVEKEDGTLRPLTPTGEYTNRHIRLSERPSLVNQRLTRKRIRQQYVIRLGSLREELKLWKARLEDRPTQEAHATCAGLAGLVEEYESFVGRQPFMRYFPFPPEIPPEVIAGI